jgi:hypothetical protein
MKKLLLGCLCLLFYYNTNICTRAAPLPVRSPPGRTALPSPAVSVSVKGTTTGTQTNVDGKYTIKAADGDVLAVLFSGLRYPDPLW